MRKEKEVGGRGGSQLTFIILSDSSVERDGQFSNGFKTPQTFNNKKKLKNLEYTLYAFVIIIATIKRSI